MIFRIALNSALLVGGYISTKGVQKVIRNKDKILGTLKTQQKKAHQHRVFKKRIVNSFQTGIQEGISNLRSLGESVKQKVQNINYTRN